MPRGYVVDTNVLSRREDHGPGSPVARWIERHAGLIRVSVITLAEARRGLILLGRRIEGQADARVRAREGLKLRTKTAWYELLRSRFADRIEPIDAEVAERWAEVSVDFPSLRDGDKALLATALVRGYGVATRNLRDFADAGVPLTNPFDPGTWNEAAASP